MRPNMDGSLGKLDPDEPTSKGVLAARCGVGCVPRMEGTLLLQPPALTCYAGRNDMTHSEEVGKVLEGPRPKAFFETLFGEPCLTFDFKWLRAMHTGAPMLTTFTCLVELTSC